MSRPPSAALPLLLVLVVAACAPAGSPSPAPVTQSPAAASASAAAPPASVAPSDSATPSSSAATGGLEWTPCRGTAECADLDVPVDYSDPSGPTISIALVRHRATDPPRRIGSLLYNPGGPGASGADAVADGHMFIFGEAARARFDIVGFDPRGVGESEGVTCLAGRPELTEAFPDEPAEIEEWLDDAEAVALGCEANHAELLPHLGTLNAARDMDRIRAAVGDEGLTYLGHSYGTLLGATYAEEFPANVRALVLDAPVDPAIDGATLIAGQAEAMEAALERFFAACEGDLTCEFAGGRDPGAAFDEILAPFEEGDVGGVTGNVAFNGIAIALITGDWGTLETALDQAAEGDPSVLGGLGAFGSDPGLLDAYDAIACLDLSVGHDPAAYEALARRLERTAPRLGRFLAYSPGWGSVDCAFWTVPPQREARPIDAEGAPPILVIGGTGDPATPYEWAEALAEQLPGSVLLTREGEGHGSYGRSACIGEHTDPYLVDLELPEPGTRCPE